MTRNLPILFLLSILSSCAGTPEQQSDRVALASYKVISQVQSRVETVCQIGTLSPKRCVETLQALYKLNDLVYEIESTADLVGGAVSNCATITLNEQEATACDREDITKILVDIRNSL